MKRLSVPIFALCLLAACENKASEKKEELIIPAKDTVAMANTASYTGCYMMTIEKDTAYMHLDDSASYLSGHLSYNRFEKDSNRGSVTLKAEKGKLKGWYNFMSEGQLSVREIVFKITGTSLAEAYGDVEMKGDSVFFKYPAALHFEDRHTFVKTVCK
ncbi:MAG: hypothetical protein ABJA37_13370 [Ferruginibacter sp.]